MKVNSVHTSLSLLCWYLFVPQLAFAHPYISNATYNERSSIERVELATDHRADYTYRGNGQIIRANLQNPGTPPTDQTPWAQFSATPSIGGTTADIHYFDSNASSDLQDPNINLFARWDFDGDGVWDTHFTTDKTALHQFTQPGDYTVYLEIKDSDGYSAVTSKVIRVFDNTPNIPPTAVITSSVGASVVVGTPISFSGSQSSDSDGEIIGYEWYFDDGSQVRTYVSQTHSYSSTGNFTVTLTVTDDRGTQSSTTKDIEVVDATVPQAPTIATQSGLTSFSVQQGVLLDIPLDIQDADTDISSLSIQASGLSGAHVQNIAGIYHLYFQPSGEQTGNQAVTVNVQDPEGPTASLEITITITSVADTGQLQWKITQPGSPLAIGSNIAAIDGSGGYLYLEAGSTKDLVPVGISNPASPVEYSYINVSGGAQDLDYDNNRVYLAAYNNGVNIYSPGSAPSLLGQFAPAGIGSVLTVKAAGNTAFATNESGTLHVINTTNAASPTTYKTLAGAVGAWAYSPMDTWNGLGYLYVGTSTGVKILNYQVPASASFVGTPITGNVRSLHIPENQNKLYVGIDNELKVYDITNRTSPSLIASLAVGIDSADIVREISVDESGHIFIFLEGYETGIYYHPIMMLELTGNTLTIVQQFDLETSSQAIYAQNGYLYLDKNYSLYVYRYQQVLNHKPVAQNQTLSVQINQSIPVTLTATDSDGDSLSYHYIVDSIDYGSLTGTAPNLTYTASGGVGQDSLQFYANDGAVDSMYGTVVINVEADPRPPVVNAIPPKSVNEGETLDFTVTGYDPDFGDTFTIAASGLPTGATFSNNQFSWAPVLGQASATPYEVTFTATDSTSLTGSPVTAQITVNHPNQSPAITQFSASPPSGYTPLNVTFTVQANDPDGTISSTLITYGDGQQGSGLTHTYLAAGNYTAIVTVTDNEGGQANAQLGVAVQEIQYGELQFTQTTVDVQEADGTATVYVERVNGSQGAVSVECVSSNGSATGGSDFTQTTQTLNWANGDAASKPCGVAIIDDPDVESTENLTLTLQIPVGAAVGTPSSAQINISDNDVLDLQVDKQSIAVPEGGAATYRVRLTARPGTPVEVTTGKASGDNDLTLQSGSLLTFDSNNWDQYQSVTVEAAEDADYVEGTADFTTSASGLTQQTVTALEIENDTLGIIADTTNLYLTEDTSGTVQISLTAQPQGDITVFFIRSGGDPFVQFSPGMMTFNSGNWNTPQTLTITALADANHDDGAATISAMAGGAPTINIIVYNQEDEDRDGIPNITDPDDDNDGLSDEVEISMGLDPLNSDSDNDGAGDASDNCPLIHNSSQLDTDGDAAGDACDADDDNDGVPDADDADGLNPYSCRDADNDTCDDCSTGQDGFGPLNDYLPANDGTDSDLDGLCDNGDPDDDGDGVNDSDDNCHFISNNSQLNTDGDAEGDACDADDDNDGVTDADDADNVNPFSCRDIDADTCDDCSIGQDGFGPQNDYNPGNDGIDTDLDGTCNPGDPDDDGDGVNDNDDNCPLISNESQLDTDGDAEGDACDADDDNDGVPDVDDSDSLNPQTCRDIDNDTCDDCSIGQDGFGPLNDYNPGNDGLDTDLDGQCNAGDTDDDGDGVNDSDDNCPLDSNESQLDTDGDAEGDACDADDDNDGVPDTDDADNVTPLSCRDLDNDDCDDCSIGQDGFGPLHDYDPANDGLDTDQDGQCNAGDTDDDGDGVIDDEDNCPLISNESQINTDGDSEGNACDADDDNDEIPDDQDNCPLDSNNSQLDTDSDTLGDVCDADDDNDGIPDVDDNSSLNPRSCRDADNDTCDDCSVGQDGFGPLHDYDPAQDGTDTDLDGTCDLGDNDDDGDGVLDGMDNCPLVGNESQTNTDGDAEGDDCDSDDDNDGVPDTDDLDSLNPSSCRDLDNDTCDDCSVGQDDFGPLHDYDPAKDGLDTDLDGQCNAGDTDDDGDGVIDDEDNCPLIGNESQLNTDDDSEGNACDEDDDNDNILDEDDNCPLDSNELQENTDGDDYGNVCDEDDDNDGVTDIFDTDPLEPTICRDLDNDTCDDCSVVNDGFGPEIDFDPNNDGPDFDQDGYCDTGDLDDDNDTIPDAVDNCDFTDNAGQTDTDNDTFGDACDTDDDNDGVPDEVDDDSLNPKVCRDLDNDTCDDCSIGIDGFGPLDDFDPLNDGVDTDNNGICNESDEDDDGDGINDSADNCPLIDNPQQEDADSDGIGNVCDDTSNLLFWMTLPAIINNANITPPQ